MYKGELDVLTLIAKKKESDIAELAKHSSLNPDSIRRIVESLKAEGFVNVSSDELTKIIPLDEFAAYAEDEMPETKIYRMAKEGKSVADLSAEQKRFGLSWAKLKGFIEIVNGLLKPRKKETEVIAENKRLVEAFAQIRKTGSLDDRVLLDELFRRKLVKKSTEKRILVKYSGKELPKESAAFDISAPAAKARLGKSHVMTHFMNKVKQIMVELGFEEMDGSVVESTFWCFDALFQPQDHPARDLADTFYLEGTSPLPKDKSLIKRVKLAHEQGWKYKWSESVASQTLLRTHTTSLSARNLAALSDKKPKKFFAVGRVFRNEATDFKHLAEFHQVEGIIAWEGATFRDLLGIIKEFYKKLGFEKIRFRPSFFPYTEPSLEVEVFFEPRGEWLELGGAGIFRPEVSIPLAGIYPVLAWGLSLERPLMLLLGLEDIRTFYRNDLDFLKGTNLNLSPEK
jgi:phenylalanyl-tRNA synthetase alpha chain